MVTYVSQMNSNAKLFCFFTLHRLFRMQLIKCGVIAILQIRVSSYFVLFKYFNTNFNYTAYVNGAISLVMKIVLYSTMYII